MIPTLRILFRCDVSHKIGFGHLYRCAAIAERILLLHPKSLIVFAVDDLALTQTSELEVVQQVISIKSVSMDELLLSFRPNAVILDGYNFSSDYEAKITKYCKLLRIDDGQLCRQTSQSDVILNSGPSFLRENYPYTAAKLWLGPSFHPLRRPFIDSSKNYQRDDKTLLIIGGSDPLTLTLPLLKRLYKDMSLRVVCGPGMSEKEREEIKIFCLSNSIELHHNPPEIAQLMLRSKQAITAAGSTVYELAALRIPLVVIQVADNQKPLSQWLSEQGVKVLLPEDLGTMNAETIQYSFHMIKLEPGKELEQALKLWLQHLSLK